MPRSTRSSNGVPYWLVGGQSYVHSRVLIVAARVKESNDRAEANTVMKRTMLRGVWTGYLGVRNCALYFTGGAGGRRAQVGGLLRISGIYTIPIRPTRRRGMTEKNTFRDRGGLDDDDSEGLGGVDTESLAWQRCGDILLQFFP